MYENLTKLISAWLDVAIESRSDLRSVFCVLNGKKFLKDEIRSGFFFDYLLISPRLFVTPFRNKICFDGEEFLAPRSKLQDGGSPLVGRQGLLVLYIRSYPPYWRPFFHPQPEEASCRGNRYPLIKDVLLLPVIIASFARIRGSYTARVYLRIK